METSAGASNTSVADLENKLKIKFDKTNFDTLVHIPVFDAHNNSDLNIDFTEDVLQRIIDKCNSRIADTGDCPVITDGHTSSDPEHQPEHLGFASSFCMGEIGKVNPRKAIFCDLHIHKAKMAKVKELPRRSVELWADMCLDPIVIKKDDTRIPIDGIALLNSQRPERDLGLLFSKNNLGNDKYQYEIKEFAMDPDAIVAKCLEGLMATPEMAYLRKCMSKDEAEAAETQEDEMDNENLDAEKGKEEDVPDDDENVEPAKLRMQRDQGRRQLHKLEEENKLLFSKIEALEIKERAATRKADLLSLEGEGYAFDMAEEMENVLDMEPVRYQKHLSRIRKCYAKAPINVNVKVAPIPVEGGSDVTAASPSAVYEKLRGHYTHGRTLANLPTEEK
jgi:hypothetical protein